jgi:hypothetical protein
MNASTMAKPSRRTPTRIPEDSIKRAILDYLRWEMTRTGRVVRVERRNGGAIRRADGEWGARAYLVYLPGVPDPLSAGVEDITGVLRDGRFFGIEIKTGEGRMSKDQRTIESSSRAHGVLHLVARSVNDVMTWLQSEVPK